MSKTGLGKGLSALIPPAPEFVDKDEPVLEVEVDAIKPNTFQPRRVFDEGKLGELVDSIREHGVVQPVVVRPLENGKYELVVGERRLRACQRLAFKMIPAVIKDFTNAQMMEIALVENIQRQDLNPVEEAWAYKRLMEEFNMTQEQVAKRVSKSRSLIANMVRLLHLPDIILDQVSQGNLTVGHVRPLLSIETEDNQIKTAELIVEKNFSVRETEELVRRLLERKNQPPKKEEPKEDAPPPQIFDIEERLRSRCGTKVRIKNQGEKGKIEIDYYNNDDLDRIVSIILRNEII